MTNRAEAAVELPNGENPVVVLQEGSIRQENEEEWEEREPVAIEPPLRQRRWTSFHQEVDPGRLAELLVKRLEYATGKLVDGLFEYLSKAEEEDEVTTLQAGLTLPVSALAWLSSQLYPATAHDQNAAHFSHQPSPQRWMGASMRDRLSLLKYLLPRVSHLRIVLEEWPPVKKKGKDRQREEINHTSFEGRDLHFSAMSVTSAITTETHLYGGTPSIQAFLLYYHGLQSRPRIDLRLFPNLSVLLLNQVAPETLMNLSAVRNSLKLLRHERGCIFDLNGFLFGKGINLMEDDDVLAPAGELRVFGQVTHLKLSHCGLGELSGLRGKARVKRRNTDPLAYCEEEPVPPPLSRFPELVSLSLSHNQIVKVRSACAGLSSLWSLRTLDLSHNFISSMKSFNAMVGSITTLILTGNRIKHVRGLDRLFSLEVLHLDANQLPDIAAVAGLANLPQLRKLFLLKNPLVIANPRGYRVNVLNLFKERRMTMLGPNPTFRHLLLSLPELDGAPATKTELLRLRALTYKSSTANPILSSKQSPQSIIEEPTPTGVTQILVSTAPFIPEGRPRRVNRTGKRRRALVEEEGDCVSSLSKLTTPKVRNRPKVEFSAHDILAKLAPPAAEKEQEKSIRNPSLDVAKACEDDQLVEPIATDRSVQSCQDKDAESARPGTETGESARPVIEETACLSGRSVASVTLIRDNENTVGLSLATVITDESNEDVTEELNHKDSSAIHPMSIYAEADTNGNEDLDELAPEEFKIPDIGASDDTNRPAASEVIGASTGKKETSIAQDNARELSEPDEALRVRQKEQFAFDTSVNFPEHVWEDNQSVPSSLGASRIEEEYQKEDRDRYQIAEVTSEYDGPDAYKLFHIGVNLELYLRCFVFATIQNKETNELATFVDPSLTDEEELSRIMLETAPRIQLRPVDRKSMEHAHLNSKTGISLRAGLNEKFVNMFKEDILACGRPSTRRLTPNRSPRRGFHGDISYGDGKLQKVSDCRKVILVTSNASIYFIPDHDALATPVKKGRSRKFPSPIPEEAFFQDAPWPHAIARHSIESLKRITIGFGFQRLVLHFDAASEAERMVLGNGYTYIVSTSNKMRTIVLLQELQKLSREVISLESAQLLPESTISIDNDDKRVLDALNEAVSPNVVGVVVHYQVLRQRWKHGDRGAVRRACVVTDTQIFLLDEDYVGDGSESFEPDNGSDLAEVRFGLVDYADLAQVSEVQAASFDPKCITIVIRPSNRLQRTKNWRLLCRDGEGAERLVDDVRKAIAIGF